MIYVKQKADGILAEFKVDESGKIFRKEYYKDLEKWKFGHWKHTVQVILYKKC